MTKRKPKRKPKRIRRTHSDEFKQEAVKHLIDSGLSVSEVSRNLGVHANLLRNWKLQYEADQEDPSLTEDERMELARLRDENRRLKMEREILKKAAAFFANEKN